MTVLKNVEIEYKEAETFVKRHNRSELNHIISKILRDLEIKEKELETRKASIKNDFIEAFKEVELMRKGKLEETDLKDLINELKQNV